MSIVRGLRRVFADILAGKNIEAYVVAAIAIALAVLGVLDNAVSDDWKLTAILAALALLVFNTTRTDNKVIDLDAVLQDRQSFGAFQDVIKGKRVLWIYGPSAINVLRDSAHIKREILDRGGEVRIIIQDMQSEAGMHILAQQIDQTMDLKNSIVMSHDLLKRMKGWGKVELRVLSYSPGFSLVVVDPDARDGKAIVEFFGYRNELITERMHIEITRQQSQHWFEYWADQFQKMWDEARPAGQEGSPDA
jgi:hypothetical protein